MSISQISPGRKNSLVYEIDGSDGAWGWDSEQPDQAWAGHRERPNEILIRNPALMGAAGQAASSLPAGHVEGFFDTFCAHFRAVYADVVAGAPSSCPSYPTFADGHDEMLVGDAIARSAREGRWVEVDRSGTAATPGPRHLGARPMRLGLLTAPFPETPLTRGRRLDGRQRIRKHRDRLLAALERADPPLRGHVAHRCRGPLGVAGRPRSSTRSGARA